MEEPPFQPAPQLAARRTEPRARPGDSAEGAAPACLPRAQWPGSPRCRGARGPVGGVAASLAGGWADLHRAPDSPWGKPGCDLFFFPPAGRRETSPPGCAAGRPPPAGPLDSCDSCLAGGREPCPLRITAVPAPPPLPRVFLLGN
ncbi:unnamed protein product [Natator depressus]